MRGRNAEGVLGDCKSKRRKGGRFILQVKNAYITSEKKWAYDDSCHLARGGKGVNVVIGRNHAPLQEKM